MDSQRRQSEMTLRRAAFTAQHLDELPDNVKAYKGVGKAYFLEPKADIMSQLEAVVKHSDNELKAAAASKESLLKEYDSLRTELTGMIGSLMK